MLLEKSFRNGTLKDDEEDIKGAAGGLYGGESGGILRSCQLLTRFRSRNRISMHSILYLMFSPVDTFLADNNNAGNLYNGHAQTP